MSSRERTTKRKTDKTSTADQAPKMPSGGSDDTIFRIPPYYFIHVLDQNRNVTRVEVGPQTYIRQDNERVVSGPSKMIVVPPRHYCVVENPVVKNAEGEVQFDVSGQVKLLHADLEVSTVIIEW